MIEGERRFAFWDTVRNRFDNVWGAESWCSIEELNEAFHEALMDLDVGCEESRGLEALRERLIELARAAGAAESYEIVANKEVHR